MSQEYSIRPVEVRGAQAAGQLSLQGNFDMQSLGDFGRAVDELIEDGKSRIVVDFEAVDFIASPIVGVLMSARRRLRKIGGDLALSGLPDQLSEKLSLMGVDRVFRFYATPKNAFEDFSDQENAETVSMRLPARPEYVTALRHTLSALLKQKGYDPKTVFRVETIADELANNAIEHGTHKQGCFVFDISLSRSRVDIAARNAHPPMDAVEIDALREKFMNPSVDAESIRGRGIALIKMLSDHVNLDVTRDQTTVSVTKYRNSEARQAA